MATLAFAALVYMLGNLIQSPRMLSWAKGELWEAVFSVFVVSMVLFSISTFCGLTVGEIGSLSSSLPKIYVGNEGKNLYESALMYLENVAGFGLRNMAQLRANLGAYEIRTSFQQYNCDVICWLSLVSITEATYSGESVDLSVTNNLLGAATVAYLSTIFQYFTLQYIVSGLFIKLLPLAIVIRSIPFMRNFGGALIGIILALYIMYPFAQLSNAVILPYLAKGVGTVTLYDRDGSGCAGIAVFHEPGTPQNIVICSQNYEKEFNMGGKITPLLGSTNLPLVSDLKESIKVNVLMFLAGIFLPAFEFIIIISLARDISALLGDEADIARLGQMV
jgi:hypothetical protein